MQEREKKKNKSEYSKKTDEEDKTKRSGNVMIAPCFTTAIIYSAGKKYISKLTVKKPFTQTHNHA